jgi:hypothetical protein
LHARMFVGIVGNPICHTFHVSSLLPEVWVDTSTSMSCLVS